MRASTNTQEPPGRRAGRRIPLTALATFLLPAVLAILLAAGCSGSPGTQQALEEQQQQNEELQQKVDELEKQKQEDLQKQIDDLKAQQEEQKQQDNQTQQPQIVIENNKNFDGPASAAPEGVVVTAPDFNVAATTAEEAAVLDVATVYYQAAEIGDYTYTYNLLSRSDQASYTLDEWWAANTALDSAAGEFVIYDISPIPDTSDSYDVSLTVYLADGSSFDRTTEFVYEDGVWKHSLTGEEISMFDNVLAATPTATAEQYSTAAAETCEPSALATRQWEGWVAPSGPFGHPPCQNAEGTYRSYIPLGYGITPMQKYLDAAETGDYDTMYNLLAPADQQHYTLDEWRQANEAIGTDQSTYEMAGTLVSSDEQGASMGGQAIVKLTVPSGETVTKYWWFGPAREGEPWVHWLNDEEIKLLDDALGR
jgi:TolA-binding protein